MRVFPAIIFVAVLALVTLVAIGFGSTSNCGGNSAALNGVRQIAQAIRLQQKETPRAKPTQGSDFLIYAHDNNLWLDFGWGVKSYWLKRGIAVGETAPIVICGEAFSNVPEPTLWNFYQRTPGHAAATLDGQAHIMTPSEFKSLDTSQYIQVTESNWDSLQKQSTTEPATKPNL